MLSYRVILMLGLRVVVNLQSMGEHSSHLVVERASSCLYRFIHCLSFEVLTPRSAEYASSVQADITIPRIFM